MLVKCRFDLGFIADKVEGQPRPLTARKGNTGQHHC
jgi:hypothetical protein